MPFAVAELLVLTVIPNHLRPVGLFLCGFFHAFLLNFQCFIFLRVSFFSVVMYFLLIVVSFA